MRRALVLVVLLFLLWAPGAYAWTWPVQGPVLVGFVFDAGHPYAGGQHRGIDIGSSPGTAVLAPAAGTVSFAGTVPTSGKSVTIATPDGYSVTLTHLGSIDVAKGASVGEGQGIGTVGPSGTPELDVPYLYLGVRVTAEAQGYLDPLSFLPALPPPVAPDPSPAPAPPPAAASEPAAPSTAATTTETADAPPPAAVTATTSAAEQAPAGAASAPPDPAPDATGASTSGAGEVPAPAEAPPPDPTATPADAPRADATPTPASGVGDAPAPADPPPPAGAAVDNAGATDSTPAPIPAPAPAPSADGQRPAAPSEPPAQPQPAPAATPTPAHATVLDPDPGLDPTASEAPSDSVADAAPAPTGDAPAMPVAPPAATAAPVAESADPPLDVAAIDDAFAVRSAVPMTAVASDAPVAIAPHAVAASRPAASSRTRVVVAAPPVRPRRTPRPDAALPQRRRRPQIPAAPARGSGATVAPRPAQRRGTPWWPFVLVGVLAAVCAAAVKRVRMISSSSQTSEGARAVAETEDPRRGRMAVRERTEAPGACRGPGRPVRHLRPLPPAQGQRRPHGERDGRARHAGDGVRGPGGRFAP